MERHLRNNSSLFHLVAFKTFLMMFHILCTISYNIKVKAKQTSRSQVKLEICLRPDDFRFVVLPSDARK